MMKKLLSGVTIGLLGLGVSGFGAIASADTTSVEYDVDSTYTLIIPQRVELNADAVTNMSIKTVNRNLEPGKSVDVSITSGIENDGEIKLERNGSSSDTLTSTLKAGGSSVLMSDPVVGTFSGYEPSETEIASIEFGIPQGTKLAGGYSQTIVFTASPQ